MDGTVTLYGLTARQRVLADVMWTLNSRKGVEGFIRSLPHQDQLTCRSIIECMQLTFTDCCEDTTQANEILDRIRCL